MTNIISQLLLIETFVALTACGGGMVLLLIMGESPPPIIMVATKISLWTGDL